MSDLKTIVLGAAAASMALALAVQPAAADYPCKTMRVVVASSAGGGTDTFARAFAAMAEKDLGVKIIVSNNGAALGTAGAAEVWQAPHDGCTVLSVSESSMTYGVNGGTTTAKDWHYHIFGGSPGVIAVRADSPYKTFEEFLAATKANPGKIKMANSGIGKLWHLKVLMVEKEGGIEFKHVGFNGSKPAMTALLTGEVDAVSASTGEISPYVESGKMRPLIITETSGYSFPGGNEIPAVTKFIPGVAKHLPMGQFLGYEFPRDVPPAVLAAFRPVFDKVVKSAEFKKFLDSQGARLFGVYGKKADEMTMAMEQRFSWFMQDLGKAKVNPETLGIKRP